MHRHIQPAISFGIACIGFLATALLVLPAVAGTNSWTAIGPVAYPFAVDPSSPSTIYSLVNRNTVIDPSPSSPSTVYPAVNGNTVYDKAHGDYLYTKEWVAFVIEKMRNDDEYRSLYA
jgi:hypothetical protein